MLFSVTRNNVFVLHFSDAREAHIKGEAKTVYSEYRRGLAKASSLPAQCISSQELAFIPTANLSTEGYLDLLSEHPSGVYFGWAGLPRRGIYKMAMSIGWNPYFNNSEKTIEPWLLHDFEEDFYGEELRLVVVGYIRPEANFPSLEALMTKIQVDGSIAEKALDLPVYAKHRGDAYLTTGSIQE